MKFTNAVSVLLILTLTYNYITGKKCLSPYEQKIIYNGLQSSIKLLENSLKKKSSGCPTGWKYYNAHCYWFSRHRTTWFDAENHCRDKGGHLVKVDNWRENKWLKKRAIESNKDAIWYGAFIFDDGKWRWTVDFSTLTFNDWIPGQPSGGEHCLDILKGHKYQWNDTHCSGLYHYVCERHHKLNFLQYRRLVVHMMDDAFIAGYANLVAAVLTPTRVHVIKSSYCSKLYVTTDVVILLIRHEKAEDQLYVFSKRQFEHELERTIYNPGLTCLSCYGITHPRFCDVVDTCQDGEVCALQRYLDPSGLVTYNVGCVVNSICHQRRSGPNAVRTCIECCSQDICNDNGCGEYGHSNFTGHYCYNCKGFLENDDCRYITACNENEVCSIQEESRFDERFFTSGCRDKQVCPEAIASQPILGKRTLPDLCNKCCLSNLCSKDCQENTDNEYKGPIGTTFYIADLTNVYTQLSFMSMHNGSCDLFRPNGSIVQTISVGNFMNSYPFYLYETTKDEVYELHCNTQIYLWSVENTMSENIVLAYVVLPGKQCTALSCMSEARRVFYTAFDTSSQNLNSLPLLIMANQTTGDDTYFVIPNIPGKESIDLRVYSTGACNIYAYDSKLNLVSLNSTNNGNTIFEISIKSENITSISTSCLSTLQMVFFSGSYPVGMTAVPGINQYISHYYHVRRELNGTLSIVILSAHTSKLLLNGSPIVVEETKEIQINFGNNANYVLLTVNVPEGYFEVYTTDDIPSGLWYADSKDPPMPIAFKIKT